MSGNQYFFGDPHFGHEKIIEYCNRPFKNAEEMGREIVLRWNSVVNKRDRAYLLGDITLSKDYSYIKSWIDQLNGVKFLIMGNHDRLKPAEYRTMGFKEVYDKPILIDDWFWLSHQQLGFMSANMPYVNVHGHTHNVSMDLPNYVNASADVTNFTPISKNQIMKRFK